MDLNKLYCTKHWLEYSSFSLNLENFVILTNSLLLLQNENHFKKMFFWGVIRGLEVDYYISVGYKTDAILDRSFFYSDNCQHWKLLPVPQDEHIALAELCRTPFQGDPGLVIEVVDDAPLEELVGGDSDDESDIQGEDRIEVQEQIDNEIPLNDSILNEGLNEEEEMKRDSKLSQENQITQNVKSPITSGTLKEEDRLAAVVKIITEETSVIPRGALFKQTDGTNVHSRAFEGLGLEDADELCSFQHYRLPQKDWNTNLMSRDNYNYAIDYLDTIDKDIPSDCWSAQLMEGDRVIVLRNLFWPDFMFFHHLETPDYGCVYIGNGQRNLDVPFMTQVGEKLELKPRESVKIMEKSSRFMHATNFPLLDEGRRESSAAGELGETKSNESPISADVERE